MPLPDQPVHGDASTVLVETSTTVVRLSTDESIPNDSHSTSAQQDTNSIEPDIQLESDGDFEFYMNNSPHNQTTSRSKNSELAGEDDDDDDTDTVNRAQSNKDKSNDSNGSLAIVAGAALERLTDAITVKETTNPDHTQETEVYMEINDFNQQHTTFEAQLPREQSEATNQNKTTSLPATLKDVNNESTNVSSTESPVTTPVSQSPRSCDIGTSKDILTEGQAFAYVGLCLVTANTLFQALDGTETSHAKESLENFVSKLINRLYKHLEIDADTQRTIAQLPQMMIQPEDLLESFVADGTQRIVSSQQVDQSDLYTSRPTSPLRSYHSREASTSSQSSVNSLKQQQQSPPSPIATPNDNSQKDVIVHSTSPIASTSNSVTSISSVPRESISSFQSDLSNGTVGSPSVESFDKVDRKHIESTLSRSSTLVNESQAGPRSSISSQKAITVDLRWTLVADLFLISISDSIYDSRARVLLKTVGTHLGLDWNEIVLFEKGIVKQLQSSTNDGLLKPDTKSRNDESRKRRMIMMGLATVGGGLVLGLSAGLFAPLIGAGIGAALAGAHITGATATAASAFLAGSGGIAVITSGAAVTGSGIAMKKMARRTAGIDTFEFLSIHDHKRVNVILTISGWLDIGEEDASLPFSTLDPINGDHFALLWEPDMLMQLGNAIKLLATEVITLTAQEILKHTLLSALLSALAWPMALTRLGYLIDNPWSIALDRAKLAGLVLADSLLMRSYLGFRPVTLVGYSLGARVIFYCLMELGRLDAFGIVENAYLFGAPITASETQWRQARSAVAGEFVNGYLRNDWVLGFLFRATTGGLGTVAGLRPINNVPGLTNMDLTSHVEGHLDYRVKIPLLMKLMGLKITSESFLDKEEAILHQRSLKINPKEVLKAPKPMMPSKAELAKSEALTESEKLQLEIAFRRPAPKAKIPNLDEIKGLTPEELEVLREALMGAAAAKEVS
ncbi:hypothetical protein BGX21_001110 [Mortierella sp. AD011]|nr:hypothetical protein BGX20_002977 [Mortierella sp. AD010]KAF9385273.1 hypothetical protein BGX21_001110 [Mortierella sp. AD011]